MVAPWSAPDVAPEPRPSPSPSPLATPVAPATPRGARMVTHPLTRFDIVDTALDTIKAAPWAVLGATALFLVPFEIVSVALRRDQLDVNDANEAITASWFAAVVLRLVVLSFVTFAVARLVWAWQQGEAPGATRVAGEALRRAPALVVAWIAVHVCEAVAAISFAFPLLFVAPLLFATVPVMAIEGCGPFRAMARSWRLSSRDIGLAIGAMAVVVLVAIVLSFSLSGLVYVTDALFDAFSLSGAWVVGIVIAFATSLIVVPFVGAAATLVYLDLRVRREGLDIELAAARHFDAAR